MSKESREKGNDDAKKDSARDSRERASNAPLESITGSRYYNPPSSGTAEDRKDYGAGWRSGKNK